MIEQYKELEKIINYKFKKKELLFRSLVHKSYDHINNNEKLEFLGDRVLGLVISKKLIQTYTEEKEGKKFANLVNKKTCSEISQKINLKKFMYLGTSHRSFQSQTDKIISDCLEALIGGIYLDGGLDYAEEFILNFWNEYIVNSTVPIIDAKTQLQEYTLKMFKVLPKYTFNKKKGPQHNPIFKTDVQIPNSKKIIGVGTSKKSAQQNAAKRLLKILKLL